MGYCSAAQNGSVREPVEASGSCGRRREAVEDVGKWMGDREGVGRGAGGSGEVQEVRKRLWESAEEEGTGSNGTLHWLQKFILVVPH